MYRGPDMCILVLKPWEAKRYSIVDEFFAPVFSGFRVLFRYASEYLMYHKLSIAGRGVSVLEMHDYGGGDAFWDCVHGMSAVVYFIQCINPASEKNVLGNVRRIKASNASAAILLVFISIKQTRDEHTLFKKQVKSLLEGCRYKIVHGTLFKAEEYEIPTKDTISEGFSWIVHKR